MQWTEESQALEKKSKCEEVHCTTGASSVTVRTSGTEQPSTTATEDEAMPSAQAALTSCMKSPYRGHMGGKNRQGLKAGALAACAKNEEEG